MEVGSSHFSNNDFWFFTKRLDPCFSQALHPNEREMKFHGWAESIHNKIDSVGSLYRAPTLTRSSILTTKPKAELITQLTVTSEPQGVVWQPHS